jgi:hypothetical protein
LHILQQEIYRKFLLFHYIIILKNRKILLFFPVFSLENGFSGQWAANRSNSICSLLKNFREGAKTHGIKYPDESGNVPQRLWAGGRWPAI